MPENLPVDCEGRDAIQRVEVHALTMALQYMEGPSVIHTEYAWDRAGGAQWRTDMHGVQYTRMLICGDGYGNASR